MAKIKNDPAQYQKRAVSAPMAQAMVIKVKKNSAFFTAPMPDGRYLDFRTAPALKAKKSAK